MKSKKSNNLLDRFVNYENINAIINDKLKNAKNKCLYPIKNGAYTLNDVILLYKRLGVESEYGSVYLSQIKDKKNIYKFATKIQLLTSESYKELKYLDLLTRVAIRTKNIHLPLMYNNLECSYFNKKDKLLPANLKNEKYKYINSYFSTFVELANGDLGTYIIDNIDKSTFTIKHYNNALSQCFIGILTCHRNYIMHRDTHLYNFLYHIIKKNNPSCFKYVFKDLVFYIENIGLNWVIWDFGRSDDITFFKNNNYINDYLDLLITLLDEDEIISTKYKPYLFEIYYAIKSFNKDYDLIKYLLEKKLLFSDKQIGTIITTIIL
jgi:serine/threonine protein kinase